MVGVSEQIRSSWSCSCFLSVSIANINICFSFWKFFCTGSTHGCQRLANMTTKARLSLILNVGQCSESKSVRLTEEILAAHLVEAKLLFAALLELDDKLSQDGLHLFFGSLDVRG